MENELTCCVCLDLYTEPVMLPCSHNFCKDCLCDLFHHSHADEMRSPQITCPKCRKAVYLDQFKGIEDLPFNKALGNIVRVYKSSSDSEYQPNMRKCLKHHKPLSLYCQTCKRIICDTCVKMLHSGFGHCVKNITDFIEEEKDKASASIHELEAIKHRVIARNTELAMQIGNSKAREEEFRKAVEDQFGMISQCVSVQRAKALDALSSQLSESRVPLEKLTESCSSLKSDIRVLRNTHKDALQVADPERQLKLLQGLTLRLSSLLTFKSPALSPLSHCAAEQNGQVYNVASAIEAIRQLKWTNTTICRGEENLPTRDYGTQTADLSTSQSNSSPGTPEKHQPKHQPEDELDSKQQSSPPPSPQKYHRQWRQQERKPLEEYLDSATKELRHLTGGNTEAEADMEAQKGVVSILADSIKELQKLKIDHTAQTLGGELSNDVDGELTDDNSAFVEWSALGDNRQLDDSPEGSHNSAEGASELYSNEKSMMLPSRFRRIGIADLNEGVVDEDGGGGGGKKSTVSTSLSQNGNGPQLVDDEDDDYDSSSCLQGCSSGFHFGKAGLGMSMSAPVNGVSAKPETLNLYFGRASSQCELSKVSDVASTSSAAAGIPVTANTSGHSDGANSASGGLLIMSNSEQGSLVSNSQNCSRADSPGFQPDGAWPASSLSSELAGMSPAVQVASSQSCGIGARPKVPQQKRSSGAVSMDLRDERNVGTSLKEGLTTAVSTIKSLCRVGFGAANKDASLDVNANDNGEAGAAASHSKGTMWSVSIPARSGCSPPAAAVLPEAAYRSAGKFPVVCDVSDDLKTNHHRSPLLFNFTCNDPLSSRGPKLKFEDVFGPAGSQKHDSAGTTHQSLTATPVGLFNDMKDATVTWTSFSSLPKWESTQTQVLRKVDMSDFWTSDAKDIVEDSSTAGVEKVESQGIAGTSRASKRYERGSPSRSSKPVAVTSGGGFSIRPISFDHRATAATWQLAPSPRKGRQRHYLKIRKHIKQSK